MAGRPTPDTRAHPNAATTAAIALLRATTWRLPFTGPGYGRDAGRQRHHDSVVGVGTQGRERVGWW